MTILAVKPDRDHDYRDDFDWDLPDSPQQHQPTDLLTTFAFDLYRHQRAIETLVQGSRDTCEELLTLTTRQQELSATLTDLQTEQEFNETEDAPY